MIEIKRSTESDIPFIIKAIVAAEKSGTEKLSYSTMFGLSEKEAEELIGNAVGEDIPGQELCVEGFMIAFIDGAPAGAVCAWVEAADDIPSAILKANILFHFLGSDVLQKATQHNYLIEQMNIPREKGSIQIESVYVDNKFRGLGVSNKIILEQIKEIVVNQPSINKVQIQLSGSNLSALRAYEKMGFKTLVTRKCEDVEVLIFLPSDTKIMMEITVDELISRGLIKLG